MPVLPDISASSINKDDPQAQIESVVKQLNQWGRDISNETRADVYKDNTGADRIIIGILPDGDTGIVISKPGVNVLSVFS